MGELREEIANAETEGNIGPIDTIYARVMLARGETIFGGGYAATYPGQALQGVRSYLVDYPTIVGNNLDALGRDFSVGGVFDLAENIAAPVALVIGGGRCLLRSSTRNIQALTTTPELEITAPGTGGRNFYTALSDVDYLRWKDGGTPWPTGVSKSN